MFAYYSIQQTCTGVTTISVIRYNERMNQINSPLDWLRSKARILFGYIAKLLNRLSGGRLSPNTVTIIGFLAHIPIGWLIATRHPIKAAVLLLIFGLFDTLDGELARLQKRASAKGMLLDSITDRAKEVIIYTCFAYVISGSDRPLMTAWAAAACGASLLVSYVNAWGEAVSARMHLVGHQTNKTFRTGIMTFEVRMSVVFVGLVSGRIILAVMVIAIGSTLTALGRFINISRKL